MRLFIAIDIEGAIRERIQRFMEGVRGFAPDARWVRPESLHVTLKFIGERPPEVMEEIKHVLSTIQARTLEITFRGYGFFPTSKSPRVFWLGIESGPELARLAKTVDEATTTLGILQEEHAFSPHLTLARGAGGSGAPRWRKGDGRDHNFRHLQEKLAAVPTLEFGTMTAHAFFLYESRLSPSGSRYTRIARFTLQ